MKTEKEDRAVWLAGYIIKNKATVRQTAAWSGVSKSTVHADVTSKLFKTDIDLYEKVRAVLDENKAERHMRGGLATKEMWEKKSHTHINEESEKEAGCTV